MGPVVLPQCVDLSPNLVMTEARHLAHPESHMLVSSQQIDLLRVVDQVNALRNILLHVVLHLITVELESN